MQKTILVSDLDWQEFSSLFKRERLPETIGGELLHLLKDDIQLAKIIYGLFAASSLDFLKTYKSAELGGRTPLDCINDNKSNALRPILMNAMKNNLHHDSAGEELSNRIFH
ncbi:MAG: hypothetical protein ACRBCS_06615 [Cellvibrionaceae bacterium]